MEYKCVRCNYKSKYKRDLWKHINRKNLCKASHKNVDREELIKIYNTKYVLHKCLFCELEFDNKESLKKHKCQKKKSVKSNECKNCGKVFMNIYSLKKHIKNKVCIKSIIEEEEITTLNIPEENKCEYCKNDFFNKSSLIRHLKNKVCLKKIIKKDEDKIIINQVVNNNILVNNHNTFNQNNLILNNFGDENLNYLNENYFKKLLDNVIIHENTLFKDRTKINTFNLRDILKDVHFNEKHKENNNIIPVNFNKGQFKLYDNGKFITQDKKDMFKDVLNKIFSIYQEGLINLIDIHNDSLISKDKCYTISRLNENLTYMNKYIQELDNYENSINTSPYMKYVRDSYKFLYKSLDTMAKDYKDKIM